MRNVDLSLRCHPLTPPPARRGACAVARAERPICSRAELRDPSAPNVGARARQRRSLQHRVVDPPSASTGWHGESDDHTRRRRTRVESSTVRSEAGGDSRQSHIRRARGPLTAQFEPLREPAPWSCFGGAVRRSCSVDLLSAPYSPNRPSFQIWNERSSRET